MKKIPLGLQLGSKLRASFPRSWYLSGFSQSVLVSTTRVVTADGSTIKLCINDELLENLHPDTIKMKDFLVTLLGSLTY